MKLIKFITQSTTHVINPNILAEAKLKRYRGFAGSKAKPQTLLFQPNQYLRVTLTAMKKIFILVLITMSVQFVKAQVTKIQLSGRYKIDTLSDTGRYMKDPKQFVTLIGRDGEYYTGMFGNQKIYFRPFDIVFSDEFANWIRQQIEKKQLEMDSLKTKH